MFHHSEPIHLKAPITNPNTLGLMWISVHSISLQDFIKTSSSLLDQLRIMGMKAEVCLADMKSDSIRFHESTNYNLQLDSRVLTHDFHGYIPKGSFQFNIFI